MLKELRVRLGSSQRGELLKLLRVFYMAEVQPYDAYITSMLYTEYVTTTQGKEALSNLNKFFQKVELDEPEVYVLNSCILLNDSSYTRVFGSSRGLKFAEMEDGTGYLLTPNINYEELICENQSRESGGERPLKLNREALKWLAAE